MAQNQTQFNLRTADLDNGVVILDENLMVRHFNKWLELQTKIAQEDIVGKKLSDIFPNIKEKTLLRKVHTALKMNTPTFYTAATSHYLIPIKLPQFSNSIYTHMQQDVSITPYDREKKLVALIIKDQTNMAYANAMLQSHINEIKKLNKELIKEQKLREEQHKKLLANSRSAAMGDMISMIAHQWRQPLSLITTLLSDLRIKKDLGTLDDTSFYNSFETIEKSVNYLSDTIDDFRDYFKPNKEKSTINLSMLFSKSIFFLQNDMRQNNIEYSVNIAHELSITSYKNELLQCVINIIKNSIDAFKTNNKQESKKISVDAFCDANNIQITITDNAGGIEKEYREKIFEPYFSTKNKNGTGLGLYMCKTIIEEHLHGEIELICSNNGTKVAITLPQIEYNTAKK